MDWYNYRIVQGLPSTHIAKDDIQDQIPIIKGCSQWSRDKQCIYTKELKKTTDLETIMGKLQIKGTLYFYSAI